MALSQRVSSRPGEVCFSPSRTVSQKTFLFFFLFFPLFPPSISGFLSAGSESARLKEFNFHLLHGGICFQTQVAL